MTLKKIISGGQTGADQGGLEAGRRLGLKTGGTAPMGWRTEDGPQPRLLMSYGLVECGLPGYPARTRINVQNSDLTVIFGNPRSPGSRLTLDLCIQLKKCHLLNPIQDELAKFIDSMSTLIDNMPIRILNVAGNRESKSPGIQKRVREYLVKELTSTKP